jgi:hypothetical protein
MAIIAKKEKGNFIPCPEGLWPGVCCDVVDLGMKETQWGPKHKVQIRWLAAAEPKRTDGNPHMVSGKFTLSLHEKAKLRQMLEVWRGKKFTDAELEGFDLEVLIGAPCMLQVAHETSRTDGSEYAFAQVVLKAGNGMRRVEIPKDYVRAKDRPDYVQPQTEQAGADDFQPETEISDDDIPF